MGPNNFVPWGAPAFTCTHSEIDSLSLTLSAIRQEVTQPWNKRSTKPHVNQLCNQYAQVNSVKCLTKI